MIDYAGLKAIFGDTLPEAHIFFATVATRPFVRGYQDIRKDLGLTTAHTNRSVWKRFVAKYNDQGPGPQPETSITKVTPVQPRHGATTRYRVDNPGGEVVVTTVPASGPIVIDRSAFGAGLWDVIFDGVTGDTAEVVFTIGSSTHTESVNLLPKITATSVVCVPNQIVTNEDNSIDTTIQIAVTPPEARYNITSSPSSSELHNVTIDYQTGKVTGSISASTSGAILFQDRTAWQTTIGSLQIAHPTAEAD
ncbi:tail protein [Pectobacterium phage My1]|uniref:Putative tail protein n=1 Tax=Pectobacterium phage My1 TaxID=1204539 RepID=J9QNZ3_9CAUD|nr:tail protein [Pectobacterium phage My1]AFQ22302.1 putative tail protein [Pectobacterium phage My1]